MYDREEHLAEYRFRLAAWALTYVSLTFFLALTAVLLLCVVMGWWVAAVLVGMADMTSLFLYLRFSKVARAAEGEV